MQTGQPTKKIPHHFITSGQTRLLHPRKVALHAAGQTKETGTASQQPQANLTDCHPRKPALPATPWSPWQVLCASPKAASQVTAKRNSMFWPTGDATKQQEKCNPTCTGQKPIAIASPLSRKSKKACWGLLLDMASAAATASSQHPTVVNGQVQAVGLP